VDGARAPKSVWLVTPTVQEAILLIVPTGNPRSVFPRIVTKSLLWVAQLVLPIHFVVGVPALFHAFLVPQVAQLMDYALVAICLDQALVPFLLHLLTPSQQYLTPR